MKGCLSRRDFMRASVSAVAFGPTVLGMGNKIKSANKKLPNIVLIYADDLGYGDVSCYGATAVQTPNVDRLAKEGIQFMRGYASSATCSPSRYSLLTGQYPWRKTGTGVLAGDAGMIIDTDIMTLPSMLKGAGYATGVVGKWHLGLGDGKSPVDWNGDIKPGPLEIGFDYSFLIPATGDRVPCVYVENHCVANLDPSDPITVDYQNPIPGVLTGSTVDRKKLKMDWDHGHNFSIVNGIGRIGYMSGGKAALWKDEDIADKLVEKGTSFIEDNKDKPFFLYFSTHDIHVPRVPNQRFVGKTDMGPRGDAIVQFDFQVGAIIDTLDRLGLKEDTLVVLTSDNGPVLNDGYKDQAVERVGDHKPSGPYRGGKYSIFDAGTREPFIVRWPKKVKPGVSNAYVSQIDLVASFAALTGQTLGENDAVDSLNMLDALLGKDKKGRDYLVEYTQFGGLAICIGDWKYIEPHDGRKIMWETGIESGLNAKPQLYNLKDDIGETNNLAEKYPERVKEMAAKLEAVKNSAGSRQM